jgi:hypothetical protein
MAMRKAVFPRESLETPIIRPEKREEQSKKRRDGQGERQTRQLALVVFSRCEESSVGTTVAQRNTEALREEEKSEVNKTR